MSQWRSDTPIFLQIRQRMIGMILGGGIGEGAALPSVRQVAADLSVNPLTVTKAYQSLVDLGIVEKRRGLGMFVSPGARAKLLAHERDTFMAQEWPALRSRIEALGLGAQDLFGTKDGK